MSHSPVNPSRDAALHQVQRTWSPYSLLPAAARGRLRRMWARWSFNYDVASKLRYELDMILLRSYCALSPAYRSRVRDLTHRKHLLVHLGCGNALIPGWINVDCYPPSSEDSAEILTLDMRRGLPMADHSVAALFSEHFLEHLPFDTVRSVILPEIKRILEPSGKIRVGVPNGEYFIDQYIACRTGRCDRVFEDNRDQKTPMTMLNEIAHGYGHYFLYDFETLSQLLRGAGLVNVRRCGYFETAVPEFKSKDRVDPWREAMTLFIEAEAPSDRC
jgi:predicted SAM-dependent methyltransferase